MPAIATLEPKVVLAIDVVVQGKQLAILGTGPFCYAEIETAFKSLLLARILEQTNGNTAEAARNLRMTSGTFEDICYQHGIKYAGKRP
jgi:transcriptional regulator with GAF, ATPase, and Fis domain